MNSGREGPGGSGGNDPNGYGPNGYDPNGYNPNGYAGQQGFPGQMPMMMPPGQPGGSPGSIRNTLGSGLKSSGFFQKDGHVQNMRGGFIGPKQGYPMAPEYSAFPPGGNGQIPGGATMPGMAGVPGAGVQPGGGNMGSGPFSFLGSNVPSSFQARQLILQPAGEGITGNGVATISSDNTFVMVANLPPPHTFQTMQPGGVRTAVVYATYLVDKKGKNGFLAGILSPVGNGAYRAQFRSQVPLTNYERVIVSVENPQHLGHAPNGMIVLKVKEPMGPMVVLTPIKNAAGSLWGKIAGLTKRGVKPPVPGTEAVVPGAVEQVLPGPAPGVPMFPTPPIPPTPPVPPT